MVSVCVHGTVWHNVGNANRRVPGDSDVSLDISTESHVVFWIHVRHDVPDGPSSLRAHRTSCRLVHKPNVVFFRPTAQEHSITAVNPNHQFDGPSSKAVPQADVRRM